MSLVDGWALATPHRHQMGVTSAIRTYDSCCVSAAASLAAASTVIAYITLDDRPNCYLNSELIVVALLKRYCLLFLLHASEAVALSASNKPIRSVENCINKAVYMIFSTCAK